MRLSSEDGISRLDLEVCDLETEGLPRLALLLSARLGGYAVEQKVWFSLAGVERFARELAALDEVPNGAAVLDSLEQDAAQLTVLSPGEELGSVVHLSVTSAQRLGGKRYETALSGALLLPLSALRQARQGFARWSDPKFLADLKDWGFEEKTMLD